MHSVIFSFFQIAGIISQNEATIVTGEQVVNSEVILTEDVVAPSQNPSSDNSTTNKVDIYKVSLLNPNKNIYIHTYIFFF